MTRVLADMLQAAQPQFSLTMQQLERSAGHPKHDIRLTSQITQTANHKLRELGLDPTDTTAEELYHALQHRLERDDGILRQAIGLPLGADIHDVLRAVQRTAEPYADKTQAFALKPAVIKRLLKAMPPKRALKELKYRSLDSLLKNEPAAAVLAAASYFESATWQKQFYTQYERLSPADFESRKATVLLLKGEKWTRLAAAMAEERHHGSVVVSELGTIVLLQPTAALPALAITTLLLTLEEVNTIGSVGTFLKLHQVAPDFGKAARAAASGELLTDAQFIDQAVPWRVVHQYYARHTDHYNPVVFEPHISSDDLTWHRPEDSLAAIHDALAFWQDTEHVAFQADGQQVSCNMFDVALNYVNQLPFASRVNSLFKQQVWHELMLRYMSLEHVERALTSKLTPQSELVSLS